MSDMYSLVEGALTVLCDAAPSDRLRSIDADSGPGIAADRIHRLFTPFDRLDVPEGSIEGTGLGLALSKGLVELMGGTLRAESTLGTGSAFSLELPRAEAASHEPVVLQTSAPGSDAQIVSGTVLYIEDNPSNLRLVE